MAAYPPQHRRRAGLLRRWPTLSALIAVAGRRWGIEEAFQASKNKTGLDHYQVRTYTGWYHHITLSMLAHALLAVLRAQANNTTTPTSPIPTTTT